MTGAAAEQAWANKEPDIEALRVAFAFNFAKFTTWPSAKAPNGRMKICFERGAISQAAVAKLEGKDVAGTPVTPLVVDPTPDGAASCHVLYVGRALWEQARADVVEVARANHVLLVSHVEDFATTGGHIALRTTAGRIRFEINLAETKRADLALSARVLQIASAVHR